jgi:hypothetical protein
MRIRHFDALDDNPPRLVRANPKNQIIPRSQPRTLRRLMRHRTGPTRHAPHPTHQQPPPADDTPRRPRRRRLQRPVAQPNAPSAPPDPYPRPDHQHQQRRSPDRDRHGHSVAVNTERIHAPPLPHPHQHHSQGNDQHHDRPTTRPRPPLHVRGHTSRTGSRHGAHSRAATAPAPRRITPGPGRGLARSARQHPELSAKGHDERQTLPPESSHTRHPLFTVQATRAPLAQPTIDVCRWHAPASPLAATRSRGPT